MQLQSSSSPPIPAGLPPPPPACAPKNRKRETANGSYLSFQPLVSLTPPHPTALHRWTSPERSADMAPPEELCSACDSIPFNAEDPPFGETRAELEGNILASTGIFKLGALDEISSRNCPVCRLVTIATARVQRIESRRFGPDQEIGLHWRLDSTLASACWNFQLLFFGVGPSRSVSVCFVHNPD